MPEWLKEFIQGQKRQEEERQRILKNRLTNRKVFFAHALRRAIDDMRKYHLKPEDDFSHIKPMRAYQRKGSENFFKLVKLEDIFHVRVELKIDRFQVFQVDHVSLLS